MAAQNVAAELAFLSVRVRSPGDLARRNRVRSEGIEVVRGLWGSTPTGIEGMEADASLSKPVPRSVELDRVLDGVCNALKGLADPHHSRSPLAAGAREVRSGQPVGARPRERRRLRSRSAPARKAFWCLATETQPFAESRGSVTSRTGSMSSSPYQLVHLSTSTSTIAGGTGGIRRRLGFRRLQLEDPTTIAAPNELRGEQRQRVVRTRRRAPVADNPSVSKKLTPCSVFVLRALWFIRNQPWIGAGAVREEEIRDAVLRERDPHHGSRTRHL